MMNKIVGNMGSLMKVAVQEQADKANKKAGKPMSQQAEVPPPL